MVIVFGLSYCIYCSVQRYTFKYKLAIIITYCRNLTIVFKFGENASQLRFMAYLNFYGLYLNVYFDTPCNLSLKSILSVSEI